MSHIEQPAAHSLNAGLLSDSVTTIFGTLFTSLCIHGILFCTLFNCESHKILKRLCYCSDITLLTLMSPEQDWLREADGPQRRVRGQKRPHHRGRQQVVLRLHLSAQRQAGHQVR